VHCSDCDQEVVPGPAPEATPARYRELTTVYLAGNPVIGELMCAALEAEGITAYLQGAALSGAIGELPATAGQVRVQVEPRDADRAREIALRSETA